jgi:SAM-dependent methyltransferase
MISNNKAIYDQSWTDWTDMKIYGAASRWLRRLILLQIDTLEKRMHEPIISVLDVGCGEGTITYLLAKRLAAAKVIGTDFSKTGIHCAKQSYSRENLEFIFDQSSSCLDGTYDLVTAFEVLEHVEDWQKFLVRISAASKKFLLLSFPTGRMRAFEVQVGHYRNYGKGQIEAFLDAKGFAPVKIFYAGFPFYSPLYRELCNLTDAASNSFTKGKYSWKQKTVGWIAYLFFYFLSTRSHWGDQFCGLFVRKAALASGGSACSLEK